MASTLLLIGNVSAAQYNLTRTVIRELRGLFPENVRLAQEVACPNDIRKVLFDHKDLETRLATSKRGGQVYAIRELFERITKVPSAVIEGIVLTESAWESDDNIFTNRIGSPEEIFENLIQVSVAKPDGTNEVVYFANA